jgi:hypothetical protein
MSNADRLTCTDLEAAVEAALAELSPEVSAARTLERLAASLTYHVTDSDGPVSFSGEELPPLAEVEGAVTEACHREVGLARRHVAALKKALKLLSDETARRAEQQRAEGSGFVTRAEFSAWARAVAFALSDCESAMRRAGFPDGDLRFRLRERVGAPGSGAVGELVDLLEDIQHRDGARSRKRAEGRVQVVGGVAGRNW